MKEYINEKYIVGFSCYRYMRIIFISCDIYIIKNYIEVNYVINFKVFLFFVFKVDYILNNLLN